MVGVIRRGFWEGDMWKPEAAPFRKDWSVKPSGRAPVDRVSGKWRPTLALWP